MIFKVSSVLSHSMCDPNIILYVLDIAKAELKGHLVRAALFMIPKKMWEKESLFFAFLILFPPVIRTSGSLFMLSVFHSGSCC